MSLARRRSLETIFRAVSQMDAPLDTHDRIALARIVESTATDLAAQYPLPAPPAVAIFCEMATRANQPATDRQEASPQWAIAQACLAGLGALSLLDRHAPAPF